MHAIVECVPNFSDGRNPDVMRQICAEIESVAGVTLLDVDPGAATNRTVVTLVGPPDQVCEAAFRAIRKAQQLIDMRQHHGEHPRMGATDVCPLVPVSGCTLEDCARWASALGKRVGEELGIPVYLYEHAATRPERRNLATVRSGEYEALGQKLLDPEWQPDFGPARFDESQQRSGATVIGAREFLIAWNINFNTTDKMLAHEVALTVRESGRFARNADGTLMRDANGAKIHQPGLLKSVKAVGWYIDEYQRAQLSMNLTSYRDTPLHRAFEVVEQEAARLGLRITGSELVGLVPLESLLEAGRHFLRKQGRLAAASEAELIRVAEISLGLSELSPFNADEKIVEYRVRGRAGRLVGMTVCDFGDLLGSEAPAPGGGSVAALCGALASGLASMVAALTFGKKDYRMHDEAMDRIADKCQQLRGFFTRMIDEDTEAFNRVMAAIRMPRASEEEKEARERAIVAANREATLVPFRVVEACPELVRLIAEVAEKGNRNSLSDAGVAALAVGTCCDGAAMNVRINLASCEDRLWACDLDDRTTNLQLQVRSQREQILERIRTELSVKP
ncbi:MAG: glutamate formimidoyltransferase [Candidatus Delongbacteria bacterium]|nr:glutamate formimidoyltransferase [Candidatus Delongbacteria bacterium]